MFSFPSHRICGDASDWNDMLAARFFEARRNGERRKRLWTLNENSLLTGTGRRKSNGT
jgi:hypothetical protein